MVLSFFSTLRGCVLAAAVCVLSGSLSVSGAWGVPLCHGGRFSGLSFVDFHAGGASVLGPRDRREEENQLRGSGQGLGTLEGGGSGGRLGPAPACAGCDTVWLYCVTCARYAVAAREGVVNCSGLCCGGRSHVFLLWVAVSARIALVPSPSLPCRPPPPAAAVLPRTDPLPAGIDGRCSGAHGRPQGQAKKGTRANAHVRGAKGEGRWWGERGEGRVEPL